VVQMARDQGWVAPPAQPSYTHDIFPILQRARTISAVKDVFGHHSSWADPVYGQSQRQLIFGKLANPAGGGSGNMPLLAGEALHLTPTQYELMQKWANNQFGQDWAGAPGPDPLTPEGLDRAALTGAVGSAFYPGIEAGGEPTKPIIDPAVYVGAADPMRLDHTAVGPGDMTRYMALPWQADFNACGTSWWPVPRPNDVIPQGTTSYQAWARTIGSGEDMAAKWHTLGFVVEQGGQFVEVERCDTSFIQLLTPNLVFQDVPQGPMGMARKTALAVSFEVMSTGGAVTLEVLSGNGPSHPRLTLANSTVTVGPTVGNAVTTARLWVIYETGAVGEVVNDQRDLDRLHRGEHRRPQGGGSSARARPLGQHVRGSRRRAIEARQPHAGSIDLRRRDARGRRDRDRPVQRGCPAVAERHAARAARRSVRPLASEHQGRDQRSRPQPRGCDVDR
jgi:hypothetical protein